MAGGVPVRAIAERRVADHFLDLGAVSPAQAIDYAPSRWSRVRALARLRGAGVVKGEGDRSYIDPAAWRARHSARRRRAGIALASVAILAVAAALIG